MFSGARFLLLAWLTLPSFVMVLAGTGSMAPGLVAAAALFAVPTILHHVSNITLNTVIFLILLAITIALPLALSQHVPSPKSVFSFIALALAIILVTIYWINWGSDNLKPRDIHFIFSLLIFFAFLSAMGLFRPLAYKHFTKSVFPFSEPSHFAVTLAPVACVAMCLLRKAKYLVPLVLLLLAVMLPNMTLLVVSLMLAVILYPLISIAIMIAVFFGILGGVFLDIDSMSYFASRTDFGDDSNNLSTLVYLQGLEGIAQSFDEFGLMGSGFQNLGNEPQGFYSEIIYKISNGEEVNRSDGGFLAAKIISEFGIIGIIFSLFLISVSMRCFVQLRRHNFSSTVDTNTFDLFRFSVGYMIVVEFLLRGYGYFSPTFILFLTFVLAGMRFPRSQVVFSHSA